MSTWGASEPGQGASFPAPSATTPTVPGFHIQVSRSSVRHSQMPLWPRSAHQLPPELSVLHGCLGRGECCGQLPRSRFDCALRPCVFAPRKIHVWWPLSQVLAPDSSVTDQPGYLVCVLETGLGGSVYAVVEQARSGAGCLFAAAAGNALKWCLWFRVIGLGKPWRK